MKAFFHLIKENWIHPKGNFGDRSYTEYFSVLIQAPDGLILDWATKYAPDTSVSLFMKRYQQQLEQISAQTRWPFSNMTFLCNFLMNLYPVDWLKIRIARMIFNVRIAGFSEATSSIYKILISTYSDQQIVLGLSMLISEYAHSDTILKDQAGNIIHREFLVVL